jgi:hypothetical protein
VCIALSFPARTDEQIQDEQSERTEMIGSVSVNSVTSCSNSGPARELGHHQHEKRFPDKVVAREGMEIPIWEAT